MKPESSPQANLSEERGELTDEEITFLNNLSGEFLNSNQQNLIDFL